MLDRLGLGRPREHLVAAVRRLLPGLAARLRGASLFAGVVAAAVLEQALHDVRPVETRDGAADGLHAQLRGASCGRSSSAARPATSRRPRALVEAGDRARLGDPGAPARARPRSSRRVKSERDLPNVLVVGEIYMRTEPFSNDFIAERARAARHPRAARAHRRVRAVLRLHRAQARDEARDSATGSRRCCARASSPVPPRRRRAPGLARAPAVAGRSRPRAPYLRDELEVESVPDHRRCRSTPGGGGEIDAVVSVGPLECMPNKIAEAQFVHVARAGGAPLAHALAERRSARSGGRSTTSPSRCTSATGRARRAGPSSRPRPRSSGELLGPAAVPMGARED